MNKQLYLGMKYGVFKYGDNATLSYTDMNSFIAHAKRFGQKL